MTSFRFPVFKILLLLGVLLSYGCGGGGGSATPTATVSGTVFAGPTNGASVTVRDTAGNIVAGPVTSGSGGAYIIAIPVAALAKDLIFEATGGTFDDEADEEAHGKGVPMGALSAYIAGGSLASGANVSIDPASTIIRKMVAGGKSKAAADSDFNRAFGYTPDCSVKPAFVNISTPSPDQQRLAGLRIAAFSQLTKDLINDPAKQFELVEAMGEDLGDDGKLDGQKTGGAVTTASGTAIPEDIGNRFVTALLAFQANPLNKCRLTADKLGSLPFGKTSLTTSYKVEYLPGTMAVAQGKTSFKIKLTNRSDGTPASGKSVTLLPFMHMATKSHSTPFDAVVDNGDGTYSCTVYYLMSTAMNGISMGFWELKVTIGGSETAVFYPTVGMAMGTTARTTLKGVNDFIAVNGVPEQRSYNLFFDGLVDNGGSYTFKLFVSAKESLLSWPGVSLGSQLHDQTGALLTVNTMDVVLSTDTTTWVAAADNGSGHWSVAGLTGLTPGVSGKVYAKVTVNGEQKTVDGLAVATANGYQTFTVLP